MTKRIIYLLLILFVPATGFGMHIAEGFLPPQWAILWTVIFIPFLVFGFRRIKKIADKNATAKLLFAVVGAFVFILSALKLPSVAGSSSHLTGIALGAILFGASTMSVVGLIALLFQALLLAHGGLTTLGANAFSMSVVGAFVAIAVYKGASKLKAPQWVCVFLAAFFSDILIYVCTSFQLALAFQSEASGLAENLLKFMSIFAITQLPLAIIEGVFTVFVFRLILRYSKKEFELINPSL